MENRDKFLKRLKNKLSKFEIEEVMFAYDIAKAAHKIQKRDEGMRYFEHLREGGLIMFDELKLFERDLIISFLLHDAGEDTTIFGNILKSYDYFIQQARWRLEKVFGARVADLVLLLTKPQIDNKKFISKELAHKHYLKNLKKNKDALLLKMVDRLHNLRTLGPKSGSIKIKRQIIETEKNYLPLFTLVDNRYKKYAKVLIKKIINQLNILKKDNQLI